jgi:hypothetical protein
VSQTINLDDDEPPVAIDVWGWAPQLPRGFTILAPVVPGSKGIE